MVADPPFTALARPFIRAVLAQISLSSHLAVTAARHIGIQRRVRMKTSTMIRTASLLGLLALLGAQAQAEMIINGAGATFPYPIYARWAAEYGKQTGLKLNYQSIGSGGGIAQIKAKTVDFGASDAPLIPNALDEMGVIQFPMVIGGVVPVIHFKGIDSGKVQLTADLLADIFLGKVTRWDDPRIQEVNFGMKLPAQAVTVVHRADGSGTTLIFTNYLDKVSPEWHQKVGTDKAVAWPVGVGGKGNEGVTAYVQKMNGAIGYVEFAYAVQNKMTYVKLQNKAGKFVDPTIETFQAAAANADWKGSPGFHVVLTDQAGDQSWPITGATFILLHKAQADAVKAREMLKFFTWCYQKGGAAARELAYVPMPDAVVNLVEDMWKWELKAAGKAIVQ
jgi:phosphate transport system substrate-binding protein